MMSTVEALERIGAHFDLNEDCECPVSSRVARQALPQARLEAKVIEAAREFAGKFQMTWAGSVDPRLALNTEASQAFLSLLQALTATDDALDALREGE